MLEPDFYYQQSTLDHIRETKPMEGGLDVHVGVRRVANRGSQVEVGLAHLLTAGYWRQVHEGERCREGSPTVDSGRF